MRPISPPLRAARRVRACAAPYPPHYRSLVDLRRGDPVWGWRRLIVVHPARPRRLRHDYTLRRSLPVLALTSSPIRRKGTGGGAPARSRGGAGDPRAEAVRAGSAPESLCFRRVLSAAARGVVLDSARSTPWLLAGLPTPSRSLRGPDTLPPVVPGTITEAARTAPTFSRGIVLWRAGAKAGVGPPGSYRGSVIHEMDFIEFSLGLRAPPFRRAFLLAYCIGRSATAGSSSSAHGRAIGPPTRSTIRANIYGLRPGGPLVRERGECMKRNPRWSRDSDQFYDHTNGGLGSTSATASSATPYCRSVCRRWSTSRTGSRARRTRTPR